MIEAVAAPPLTPRQREAIAAYVLSPREREILGHIGRTGDTMRATGCRLGIAESTVKNHLRSVHRKLGVDGNVATFIVLGWLKVPDPDSPAEPLY